MKRKLALAGIVVGVVLSLGSFLLYHFMTGPMDESGQAAPTDDRHHRPLPNSAS